MAVSEVEVLVMATEVTAVAPNETVSAGEAGAGDRDDVATASGRCSG